MNIFQTDLVNGLLFLFLSLLLFLVSKIVKDFLTPYSLNEELREHNNIAVSLSLCGYFFATIIVFLGALLGPPTTLAHDLLSFTGYALLGIVLLNISRVINDRFILYQFSNVKEIVVDQNAGTGAVEFGSYVASGLVVAGSIHGEGGGVHTALAFFALSQLVLVLFSKVYNLITPFDVHAEVERDNVAAGVAFGGTLVALGIILLKGAMGDFISWQYNLTDFFLSISGGIILLPLLRTFLDKVLLPGTDLNQEIADEQNLALGLLEMTVAVLFAVCIFFTIDFHINL